MNGKKSRIKKSRIQVKNNPSIINRSKKRSQGEVVSTVLMVLLVIVASVILVAFVVPLVQNFLEGGKCNDYLGKVSFTNNIKYTCYHSATKTLVLQIHVDNSLEKTKADAIEGLRIIVDTVETSSQSYGLFPPSSIPPLSVIMANGQSSIEIPKIGQDRTYNITYINIRPNSTTVYPVLNNSQTCAGASYKLDNIPYCKW